MTIIPWTPMGSLTRLIFTSLLSAASLSFSACSLALPQWIIHEHLTSDTLLGMSRVCTEGVCHNEVISEYFSYTLILMCISMLVQLTTLLSLLMDVRSHVLNVEGLCQWDIVAKFGVCSSLASLCIASFLFAWGVQESADRYGGNFELNFVIFKTQFYNNGLIAKAGMSHFFLSASIVLNVCTLFPLMGSSIL